MSVPADSDAITLEWLTAALQEAGALDQARVNWIQSARWPAGICRTALATANQLRQPGTGCTDVAGGEVLGPAPGRARDNPLDGILRARDRLLLRARRRLPSPYASVLFRRDRHGQRSVAAVARGPHVDAQPELPRWLPQ